MHANASLSITLDKDGLYFISYTREITYISAFLLT